MEGSSRDGYWYFRNKPTKEKRNIGEKIKKEEEELKGALWHFENQMFHCEMDAIKALDAFKRKYKWHTIKDQVIAVSKHKG